MGPSLLKVLIGPSDSFWMWWWRHHCQSELYKVQKVQFKFSSRHWTQQSTQVQFIRQKLNLNCCPTHHWTFLNWVQSQFRESGVPPTKKGEELQNFVCHDMEKAQFLLFSTRGHSTLSELTLNSVQKSSMVSWAAVQVQFLTNELNLNWPPSSRKKLNWIENFNSVLNCYTALLLSDFWRPIF